MNQSPIIFVTKQPQAGADGGTTSLGEIITRLRHHRPIVVADRLSRRVQEWRGRGIETHILPQVASRGLTRDPFGVVQSYMRYTHALRQLISQSGAKIVHANDPGAMQLALPAVKLGRGVKIVLNLRGTMDPARRKPRFRFRFLFGAADHVFFLSQEMANWWGEVAPNALRSCSVTYSIVDPEQFSRTAIPTIGQQPIVLLPARIRPLKGQLEFLRNVAPVLASHGIATWLAGDFDESERDYARDCNDAARPLGEMVKLLGYCDNVPQLIQRANVIAVPSRHEGLVRAMIEAMASGRPVVSFDVCSAREMLEQEAPGSGVVVRSGDFHGMAEAILRYCLEPHAAAEAGKKGVAAARHLFAPDAVVSRYENAYERLEALP